MATGVREYAYSGSGTYDDLTRIAWSDILHEQVQQKLYFNRKGFIGPDMGEEGSPDSTKAWYPILQKTELGKSGGDNIIVPLLRQLTGTAATGVTNMTATTYEEAVDFWSFKVWIETIRHAAGWDGKVSAQRNKFLNKKIVSSLLADWMAKQMDNAIFYALYYGFSSHIITECGQSATTHPNSYFGGDATSQDSVDSTDTFGVSVLERMAVWATDNNINPIKIDGEEGFVALIHPYQLHSLRQDTLWREAQLHANVRGMKNQIFSGADGMYAGIYIHTTKGVSNPASTVSDYENKRVAICLGAHAVARAVGQRPELIASDTTDYQRLSLWAIDAIFGDARADYISDDGESTKLNQSSSLWTTYAENPVS